MLTTTRAQPKVETFPRERLHQPRLARHTSASRSINSLQAVRSIRLRSLGEEPQAYAADYETEARYRPELWQQRLATAFSYLAFDDDHDLVGIATGVWTRDGDTHVVGMYVAPEARGHGCAHQLLDAIADLAIRR